jgi:radical SAM superfamily enzyme YgiQ (UPF0313 family)
MRKILFINPAYKDDSIFEAVKVPPLALATLAGLTPEEYEMKIVDENVDKINFDENTDLVAISCMTPYAPRVYEISQHFMERGIPTIVGGIHSTVLPNEASKYATSAVIGEAESVWNQVIEDWKENKLKKFYYGKRFELKNQPKPRRELLNQKKYHSHAIQTTRGCPFNCDFCSVTQFSGGAYRWRPIKEVIEEIRGIDGRYFYFSDDNIVGMGKKSEERAIKMFKEIKDLDILWASQTSVNIADNDKVLKAIADSGCKSLLVGIESFNPEVLKEMRKGINLRYDIHGIKKQIEKLHDYGIAVNAGIIFGNDHDTNDVFDQTIELINYIEFDRVMPNILTPYPGTRLYERLTNEKRILYKNYPNDWKKYNAMNVVFTPKNLTVEELETGMMHFYKEYRKFLPTLKKAIKTIFITKNLLGGLICYKWNRGAFYKNYFKLNQEYN